MTFYNYGKSNVNGNFCITWITTGAVLEINNSIRTEEFIIPLIYIGLLFYP